jgi:hypothetical protein
MYIDRLAPFEIPKALSFGRAVHDSLELFYRGASTSECMRLKGLEPEDRVKARAMLLGYFETFKTEDFNVELVEWEFEVPIRNPATERKSKLFNLRGKIDALVKRNDSRWILEHKTVSQLPQSKQLDFQTILYTYACISSGKAVDGVIHNHLIKSQSKPKKNESPQEFEERMIQAYKTGDKFVRFEEQRIYQHIPKILGTVWAVTQQINAAQKANKYIQNFTACHLYQRECDFLPLCAAGNMSAAPSLYRVKKRQNEELNNAAA